MVGRSRPAVQHILEAAVVSHAASGSLGADGGPRDPLHGGASGKLLRLRQAAHPLAGGARRAQRLQSSPPTAPVRRSVRGRDWALAPAWFRPRERRAEVWSSEASAFAWRLVHPASVLVAGKLRLAFDLYCGVALRDFEYASLWRVLARPGMPGRVQSRGRRFRVCCVAAFVRGSLSAVAKQGGRG